MTWMAGLYDVLDVLVRFILDKSDFTPEVR